MRRCIALRWGCLRMRVRFIGESLDTTVRRCDGMMMLMRCDAGSGISGTITFRSTTVLTRRSVGAVRRVRCMQVRVGCRRRIADQIGLNTLVRVNHVAV